MRTKPIAFCARDFSRAQLASYRQLPWILIGLSRCLLQLWLVDVIALVSGFWQSFGNPLHGKNTKNIAKALLQFWEHVFFSVANCRVSFFTALCSSRGQDVSPGTFCVLILAVGKTYHPEHFVCSYCGRQIGSEGFKVDRGKPYCQDCYNKLFSVKCTLCKHPIGGGERWVEAMGEPWHATCFKCQVRQT